MVYLSSTMPLTWRLEAPLFWLRLNGYRSTDSLRTQFRNSHLILIFFFIFVDRQLWLTWKQHGKVKPQFHEHHSHMPRASSMDRLSSRLPLKVYWSLSLNESSESSRGLNDLFTPRIEATRTCPHISCHIRCSYIWTSACETCRIYPRQAPKRLQTFFKVFRHSLPSSSQGSASSPLLHFQPAQSTCDGLS